VSRVFESRLCLLNLLPQDILQRHRISRKLTNPLPQLLHRHSILIEVEPEVTLIIDIRLLLDVKIVRIFRAQLLLHFFIGVEEFFEEVGLWVRRSVRGFPCTQLGRGKGGRRITYSDSQVITSRQFCDLPLIPKTRTHNNSLISKLLVVIENRLNALDTRIFMRLERILLHSYLVPIHYPSDEGGNEIGTGFCSSDGLYEGEHQGKVAVYAVFGLEDLGGFDAFPCRGDLDEHALFADADLFV
jgi:hypothetical protein